jgi:hypothetical protein
MANIYEIIYSALELVYPLYILEHALYGFILEMVVFLLAFGVVFLSAYFPIILAFRLSLKGLKQWF